MTFYMMSSTIGKRHQLFQNTHTHALMQARTHAHTIFSLRDIAQNVTANINVILRAIILDQLAHASN